MKAESTMAESIVDTVDELQCLSAEEDAKDHLAAKHKVSRADLDQIVADLDQQVDKHTSPIDTIRVLVQKAKSAALTESFLAFERVAVAEAKAEATRLRMEVYEAREALRAAEKQTADLKSRLVSTSALVDSMTHTVLRLRDELDQRPDITPKQARGLLTTPPDLDDTLNVMAALKELARKDVPT
jgi:uncharacterized protein YejL (UPF0352 family)